ncbi:Proline-rich protein 5 [Geodia barretti]|uniref:Proline-rich protein 5 n=2 Tax=Geodia barretti TaxID=519541 RepID=A0AA35WC83_GEOBA|nr:Proline-rich protein 5 [Geodia barretti]
MSSFDKTLETLAPQDARKWQEFKSSDWKKIQEAVLTLFQQKRYPTLAQDLHQLNHKLGKLFRSEVGQFIGEFYQDQILKRGMIVLRHEVIEKEGLELLKKLATVWTQFYTSILPTLQAIFAPVQLENLSIRALTLLVFRDVVLLKTQIKVALKSVAEEAMPPQIPQMLLVLQGVHRLPPTDDYFTLVSLLPYVVKPYQCLVPRLRNQITEPESTGGRISRSETMSGRDSPSILARSASPVKRRHSYGEMDSEESRGESPLINRSPHPV